MCSLDLLVSFQASPIACMAILIIEYFFVASSAHESVNSSEPRICHNIHVSTTPSIKFGFRVESFLFKKIVNNEIASDSMIPSGTQYRIGQPYNLMK